ncbi:arginine--tRNA ligase [Paenibacillus crassostreae]|uniref:Arginine--tRNA ligase n=1 Tax=Paenibacillus crassostreae TaxID=1763538 RepID=A0A167FKG0_9BACL|nr:arginine--tRNA ligase [Paenibacillus crassostreae]AOZ94310.1 arginine--tRNA ligase [Paenibacillus crassostreae]OAB76652.1 arginine--tRNA ligase [Paenibacillus crassostreae]
MLKKWATEVIEPHVSLSLEEVEEMLETPPTAAMGDMAFPCYRLAKQYKQSPQQIALQLADVIQVDGIKVEAAGPYVNLFFDRDVYAGKMMETLRENNDAKINIGQGKKVIIDMSSPNIAKPFGIGHLRSTMIGAALYKMYQTAGYEPISVNHLGDWGTQFGKQITAYKRWGNDAALKENPIQESLRLYVKFHEEAEEDQSLDPEARNWFRLLESGDHEANRLWNYFVEVSMQEFNRMYERLNITFDYVLGESFYNDKMGAVVQELKDMELLEESEGALVVRLEEKGMPPCLIMKSDGTTIYPTRDLATAFYRHQVMKADQILYVVGGEQQLHFQQVFAVLNKMGADWVKDCQHVSFGLMKFEGKKMSTRRGKIVYLEDVLDEAVSRALKVIEEKNPALPDKLSVAQAVGIGAIIFGDLKNNRTNEVDFSLEDALNFDGETGPYLQYTYTRTQSILSKSELFELDQMGKDKDKDKVESQTLQHNYSESLGESGWALLKLLITFPDHLKRGIQNNEPSVLARYVLDVAQAFNHFYNQERVISEDVDLRRIRVLLTELTGESLQRTMNILGLHTPTRM